MKLIPIGLDHLAVDDILQELDQLPIKTIGITKNDLITLIDLISSPYSHLRNPQKHKILKSYLYPKDFIPSEVAMSICGNLGVKTATSSEKKISNTLQLSLLNWLISVYSFFEQPNIIEKLYGILFNYLEFEFLRPKIAHLLFLATKKKHVNPSRIERLRGLYNKYDESEHLIALLVLYKEFAPEEIFDVFPKISHTLFSHPNYEYLNELMELRQGDKISTLATGDELKFIDDFSQKLKRRKRNLATSDFSQYLTLSQNDNIHSITSLCANIEKFTIPLDHLATLSDSSGFSILGFKFKGEQRDYTRLDQTILFSLEELEELHETDQLVFLEKLKMYTSLTSEIPKSIVSGLLHNEKLLVPNPVTDQYIWHFFRYLDPQSSQSFQKLISIYLQDKNLKNVNWICSLLHTLTYLFSSWPKKLEILKDQRNEQLSIEDLSKTILDTYSQIRTIMPEILIRHNYDRKLAIEFLTFISNIQNIPLSHLHIKDVVMPPPLVYMLFYINDPLAISLLAGHLNFSKMVLQDAVSNDSTITLTALHNSYVVDFCNTVWRNKAFDISKKNDGTSYGLNFDFINSLITKVPIFDRNSSFPILFNINHSPAFASRSAIIVRSIEDGDEDCSTRHAGPLTPTSVKELLQDPETKWLNTDYENLRIEILKEFDKVGYVGLADLLFSHLKSLLNKR